MATYLALDAASETGWAIWSPDWEKPRYGTWKLKSEVLSGRGHMFQRLQKNMHELRMLAKFDEVHVEFNPHAALGFHAQYITLGLIASAEMYAYAMNLKFSTITTEGWRADFIGRQEKQIIRLAAKEQAERTGGSPKTRDKLKAATIVRCRQLGLSPRNDNEGDALAILDHVVLADKVTPPWRRQDVLAPALGVAR